MAIIDDKMKEYGISIFVDNKNRKKQRNDDVGCGGDDDDNDGLKKNILECWLATNPIFRKCWQQTHKQFQSWTKKSYFFTVLPVFS